MNQHIVVPISIPSINCTKDTCKLHSVHINTNKLNVQRFMNVMHLVDDNRLYIAQGKVLFLVSKQVFDFLPTYFSFSFFKKRQKRNAHFFFWITCKGETDAEEVFGTTILWTMPNALVPCLKLGLFGSCAFLSCF